jgi:hypothetical protein
MYLQTTATGESSITHITGKWTSTMYEMIIIHFALEKKKDTNIRTNLYSKRNEF